METNNEQLDIKPITESITGVTFDTQEQFNQIQINSLLKVIKTNLTIPTHSPKSFLDGIYLYWDGSSTYSLYIYINKSWKKTSLI